MYIILGILAGGSIVVSRMVNATLAERIGVYPSTFYNYVTGLTVSAVLLLFVGSGSAAGLPGGVRTLVILTGGLFGLCNVVISNIVTHRIPAFVLTLLIFISQLFAGILLDYILLGVLSPGRILGGVCLLAGLYLYQRPPGRPLQRQSED